MPALHPLVFSPQPTRSQPTRSLPTMSPPRGSSSAHPGFSQQSRWRVNPQPTYSERMSDTRGEIRQMIKNALQEITQDPHAQMRWPSYWRDVVQRYHVVIANWPYDDVPFKNLSEVSNLRKLEILKRGWEGKHIFFRRIQDGENLDALYEQHAARIAAGDRVEDEEGAGQQGGALNG